jgi:hypothetical protein
MREPQQSHHVSIATGCGQIAVTAPMLSPISPVIRLIITALQPPTTPIDTGQLITPPDARDVRKLKIKTPLTAPTHHAHMSTRRLSHSSIEKPSRRHKLQDSCNVTSPELYALSPRDDSSSGGKHRRHRMPLRTTGGGVPNGRKRQRSFAPEAPGDQLLTSSRMSELLATCKDEQYNKVIYHMPEGWTTTNERGNVVTKTSVRDGTMGILQGRPQRVNVSACNTERQPSSPNRHAMRHAPSTIYSRP